LIAFLISLLLLVASPVYAADTTVQVGNTSNSEADALWGPYWLDTSKAVIITRDDGVDVQMSRTTDSGATWGETEIQSGAARVIAAWFDQETPGDTGSLVHVVWLDSAADDFRYVNVNISDGVVGTVRDVDTGVTLGTTSEESRVAITKARDGTLVACLSTQTEIECFKSSDSFASAATAIPDAFETTTEEDYLMLFPANVDDGDVVALFWDRSVNDITIKMFDASADSGTGTWTEFSTALCTDCADDAVHKNWDGAVRHSDGHILLAAHRAEVSAGDDLLTWDLTVASISTPVISAKANVFTNQDEASQVSVFINQQNDDVYLAYIKGGTWLLSSDIVFHKSTDGMGSWGTEQAYSEATAADLRMVHAGRTVDSSGGFYQPSWFNDDDVTDYVNLVNDVPISATTTRRFASPMIFQ